MHSMSFPITFFIVRIDYGWANFSKTMQLGFESLGAVAEAEFQKLLLIFVPALAFSGAEIWLRLPAL